MVKKKALLLAIYLTGIYPPGDDEAVADMLAPAYLKGFAETDPVVRERWEIKILNLPASLSERELADAIARESPDLLGCSVYLWNYEQICAATKLFHDEHPEIPIVCGGPEVSYNSEEILALNPHFRAIVCGAGESRFKELLRCGVELQSFSAMSGISYRDAAGAIRHTPGRTVEDLNLIPSPYQTGIINLDDGRRHCVMIETYRGCIFSCGYCMWMGDQKRRLSLFPIERVLRDIELIYSNPNTAYVYFIDASIFYTRERSKLILLKILEAPRKIPTIFTLDIAFLSEENIGLLRRIQMSQHQYHFGMQSTHEPTLRLMNRRLGAKFFSERIALLRRVDPEAQITFDLIYGLPGDNFNTFKETVEFALSLRPIKLNLSPLVLLPGSPYWQDREQHQFLYNPEPPYIVHANGTYSTADMRCTRRLVLALIITLYFPALREAIYDAAERRPELRRVELLDRMIRAFEERSGINLDIAGLPEGDRYSLKAHNMIRRRTMNTVSEPRHCMQLYECASEVFEGQGLSAGAAVLRAGAGLYRQRAGLADSPECPLSEKEARRFEFGWVPCNNVIPPAR